MHAVPAVWHSASTEGHRGHLRRCASRPALPTPKRRAHGVDVTLTHHHDLDCCRLRDVQGSPHISPRCQDAPIAAKHGDPGRAPETGVKPLVPCFVLPALIMPFGYVPGALSTTQPAPAALLAGTAAFSESAAGKTSGDAARRGPYLPQATLDRAPGTSMMTHTTQSCRRASTATLSN